MQPCKHDEAVSSTLIYSQWLSVSKRGVGGWRREGEEGGREGGREAGKEEDEEGEEQEEGRGGAVEERTRRKKIKDKD